MECLTILREARSAGLIVNTDGRRLIIRGPRRLADLAKRLLDRKEDVLALLAQGWAPNPEGPSANHLDESLENSALLRHAPASADPWGEMVRRLNMACSPDCDLTESDWAQLDPLENRIARTRADGDERSFAVALDRYERAALALIEQRIRRID